MAGELYDWRRQVVTFDGYRGEILVSRNEDRETRPRIEERTKKPGRTTPSISEDNDTPLPLYQPLKYKHTVSPHPSPSSPPPLSGRVSFFSLSLYTLFRFSLFCGLRRFALQLIISPFPASLYPPLVTIVGSLSLSPLSIRPLAHHPPPPLPPLARSFTIIIRGHIRPLCPGLDIQHNPP